jgi:putative (di)nucleoside polyphosphate hydrolase
MKHQGTFMTPEDIAQLPYRPCVGIMLVNTRGHVFVGQRKDNDQDAWQMPQGGVDPGETTRDAALRELEEETGILEKLVTIEAESLGLIPYDLPHTLVPTLWNGRYKGQEQKWFLLRFHGTDHDVNIATEHQEFSEWKWMPKEELIDNIVPFKREVYTRVLAEFAEKL